ncbi:hypothetical protein KCU61_g108, partial [Aureobasidium melanogenum]
LRHRCRSHHRLEGRSGFGLTDNGVVVSNIWFSGDYALQTRLEHFLGLCSVDYRNISMHLEQLDAMAVFLRVDSVLKLEQRDAETNAVQTSHESANEHSDRPDVVVLLKLVQHLGSDTTHFKNTNTAEHVCQHLFDQTGEVCFLSIEICKASVTLRPGTFATWCTSLRGALLTECSSNLLYKDSSCNASSADFTTLRSRNTSVVANHKHFDVDSCCSCFLQSMSVTSCLLTNGKLYLDSHAKVEHITSIVHDNDQNTFGCINTTQKASSNLLCRG